MELIKYDMTKPIKFIQSGHFLSGKGWQHASSTRKKDTEILIGTKNDIHVQISGKAYTLSEGTVLCVFPGETIVGTAPTIESAEFTWLHFTNQSPISKTVTYPSGFQQLTSFILPRFFKLTNVDRLLALTAQMLDATHTANSNLVTKDYFVSYYLSELANDYLQVIHQSNDEEGIINKIKEWIRTNMNNDLKVTDISTHFNMNGDYMARLFKQVTGITIKTYINQAKINLARYLLLTTDLSVSEIAERSFFNDYKYFFRLFKNYTSLTPLKYRNTFTKTFLNNPKIDPGFDVGKIVSLLEKGLDESTLY